MKSTKIWNDVEELLRERFPDFTKIISRFYPQTEKFKGIYFGFYDELLGVSIIYATQEEMKKQTYLDLASMIFSGKKEVLDAVKPNLKSLANELEKYKLNLPAEKLVEFKEAKERIKRKRDYIA